MNEEYFINQIIEIRLDTEINLTAATAPKILYTKPNGVTGQWTAAKQGTELVYTTNSSDLDIPGTWKLQTLVTKNGGSEFGAIVFQTIRESLVGAGSSE
jgi:hypothetical protein